MENEQNPGVSKKRFLPSWRASTLDLFPPDQHDKLYINYYVEDVSKPSGFLAKYISKTPIDATIMQTEDGTRKIDPRFSLPVITGEWYKDGQVTYTNEPGKHEDLIEAEGKNKEDVLAHFNINKNTDGTFLIGIWAVDPERAQDLVRFMLSGNLDDSSILTVERASDLYRPYEKAEEIFEGTLGEYKEKLLHPELP